MRMNDYEKSPDFPLDDAPKQSETAKQKADAERLQAFGMSLAKKRDDWIAARRASGWDKRVQEDLDQFHAIDAANRLGADMMTSVEMGGPAVASKYKETRSTVFIGLTRQKSNAAEARLCDILLPTDEKNWGIKPTPVPELGALSDSQEQAVDPGTGGPLVLNALNPQTGQTGPVPVKKSDVAAAAMKVAREKAAAMEEEIHDQLIECDMNGETRKCIHDRAVMGVSVIKGPVVENKTRRAWKQIEGNVWAQETIAEKVPRSYRVDPRNVWEDPECGEDIQKGEGIFELAEMTKKCVRDLVKQPGYIRDQLALVLEQGPQRSVAITELQVQLNKAVYQKNLYHVWIYTGELDPEDMRVAGVKLSEEIDPFETISGCVVMINDTVVKAYRNPVEEGGLPYDFCPWEPVTDSPRGYGIPYLMRAPQRVINAAWRMMLDNAAVCAGPQIIVRKKAVQPANGSWEITARKIWYAIDDSVTDVKEAFASVEFNSHQADLAQIIDMGMALADAETSTPMIAQGEQGAAPETVGGMQMLINSANVVLRRLVKQHDDKQTKPHIRRYYDFNMLYSPKNEIKGDFSVDARGTSALLVRDIQNQAFMNLLTAGANPVYAKLINFKKLFEKALQAQHVQPQDILKSDEEIKQEEELAKQNPPPVDPRIESAKIAADSRIKVEEARAQGYQSEIALREQIADDNHAATIARMELDRDLKLLDYANQNRISLNDAKVALAQTAMTDRTKKELFAAEATLKTSPTNPSGEGI